MIQKPITITFLGRSGCGKGTQAKMLLEYLGADFYISTGDLFRELSQKETLAGQKIAQELKEGVLLPDWLAYTLWQRELVEKLISPDQYVIFDGAPRHLSEAEFLDEVMSWFGRPPVTPILLDITREEAFKRLKLRARPDDTDENINRRLDWFEKDVVPVIEYYQNQNRLIRVDGMPPPEEVFENVRRALGG